MSSALNSLGKNKKLPLLLSTMSDRKWIPYPKEGHVESSINDVDALDKATSDLLDEVIHARRGPSRPAPEAQHRSQHGATSGATNSRAGKATPRLKLLAPSGLPKSVPNDSELLGSITKRLAQLEKQLQFQTKEIIEKDKKIQRLEEKLSIMQKANANTREDHVTELERNCLLLQQQVHEMEMFLADYGMVWVGEQDNVTSDLYNDDSTSEDDNDDNNGWKQTDSLSSELPRIDFNILVKNLQELNELAGEGIAQIQKTPGGAKLKVPDAVPLAIYANGIALFSGPFRPFTDQTTQLFVKDIQDGFFPSELQSRYPDGIPFKITDKRDTVFRDKRQDAFQGAGQVLGGETTVSKLIPSNLHGRTTPRSRKGSSSKTSNEKGRIVQGSGSQLKEESELPGRKMTIQQFIDKLPQSVLKEGKIIDIRNSVRDTLQTGNANATSSKSSVTVVDTPVVQQLQDRLNVEVKARSASNRHITTLRIKSEQGDHTYIMKMNNSDTVGDLKYYLNKQRSHSSSGYQIMSAFPMRTYDDDSATLEECGLVPNATLHLKLNKLYPH